jgi:hypothetical protein
MTQHRSLVLAFLFSASSAFGACGGGGGGGDIALGDLEDEFANEICASLVACDQVPDIASCKESLGIDLSQLIADVEAGLVEYDGAQARECLNDFNITDCNLFEGIEESDACDATFSGSVAAGGSCFSDEVCAGDAECDGNDGESCTAGVCVAAEQLASVGQSCATVDCEDGLDCNDADVCEARPTIGDACESIFECADGICDLGPDNTPGTCVVLPTTGETCDPTLGGFGGRFSCGFNTDYCDPSDNTCKAKQAPGSDCSAVEFSCVNYAACVEGTCQAEPGLGDSCVVDSQLSCLGDLDCEGGTCTAEPADPVCTL